MFEFGRDLRKLFAQARESDDLGWVELIGVELLRAEAAGQTTDAGRVSCAHPFDAWRRACALWREHARRTGDPASLERADAAADDAARAARGPLQSALAALEAAENRLAAYDLFGGLAHLAEAETAVAEAQDARQAQGVHARLKARQARLADAPEPRMDAAALLDAALHDAGRAAASERDALRLERAMLALETGLTQRDPRLLDQAGRDLRELVERAPADERPLTRARALALSGAGLKALAALAGDEGARASGQSMLDAADDQFTADHSPLDWVAVQILRGDGAMLQTLAMAQAQSARPGLILGALAREVRFTAEAAQAEKAGDMSRLEMLDSTLKRRLAAGRLAPTRPLDWAADQIALARVAQARQRLTGQLAANLGLMLVEAAATAREQGAPALAERAELRVT